MDANANSASNLKVKFFGQTIGPHIRTAVSVNSFPRNATLKKILVIY